MNNKKILILGGCGYIGTVLTNELLKLNYNLTIIDNQYFGCFLKKNSNLKILKKNILDLDNFSFEGFETIIHLANIANDPSVDLNPVLSWEVNALATHKIASKAVIEGVKKIIYSSSGSVYGIKKEKNVTEDLDLKPISVYNKTKMVAESILMGFRDRLKIINIRPATVCGYSPRMRLDVTVNMFLIQALTQKKIIVFGGNQTRPNIHILDLANTFIHFVLDNSIDSGTYNAGFENLKIIEIAKKIKNKVDCKIEVAESNDPRSYRQNSDKLLSLGFVKKYSVDYAINEIVNLYNLGVIKDEKIYYNVKWMKKIMNKKS